MLPLKKERKEMEDAHRKRNEAVKKREAELRANPGPETLVETLIRIANTPLFERREAPANGNHLPGQRHAIVP